MPQKYHSIESFSTSRDARSFDETISLAISNEAQMQALDEFMVNVNQLHAVLHNALFHRNAILSPMAEKEVMEAARLNLTLDSLQLSNFDTLLSFEDERLWFPPTRVMHALERGMNAKKKVTTDYYHRQLLVTESDIDADMKDFDFLPDICSSTEVALRNATISCVEDAIGSSKYLRKDFVLHALRQFSALSSMSVSHNFSLRELPITLMHAVGDYLKTIDLSFNQLTTIPYEWLYKKSSHSPAFPHLEVLLLNNNRIHSFIPSELFQSNFAPNLHHLNVENNGIVGFTSHLLSAAHRKSLSQFECCNNDFPDEEADVMEMAASVRRVAAVHPEIFERFESISTELVEEVINAQFPICMGAMNNFHALVEEYYKLVAEGNDWKANLMCPRCGVCDEKLPALWRTFSANFLEQSSEAEPNFFDDDSQLAPRCSIVDTVAAAASLGYYVRKVMEDRQLELQVASELPITETFLPPIAMFKVYEVLGNLHVPIIFFSCGRPSCVDEVVDVVGGEGEGLIDYRSLRYTVEADHTSHDSDDDIHAF